MGWKKDNASGTEYIRVSKVIGYYTIRRKAKNKNYKGKIGKIKLTKLKEEVINNYNDSNSY